MARKTTKAPSATKPEVQADLSTGYQDIPWATFKDPVSEVFRSALRHFVWTPDQKTRGMPEHWGIPALENGKIRDDCDGFALYCYDRLTTAIPDLRKSAYPCVCRCETGEGHCILLIHTDDGIRVLDNRVDAVWTLGQIKARGYHDFYRPVYGQPIDAEWEMPVL